jgi:hypothetical protein
LQDPPTIRHVAKRLLVLALGTAAGAAIVMIRRRGRDGDPTRNGGRARTDRLRRELEQARQRLREELARTRGQG